MQFHHHHPSIMTSPNHTPTAPPSSGGPSTFPSSSTAFLAFPDVRALELLFALLVFIAIRSVRQQTHHGLPSWPILGMLPSLLIALRGDLYEWLTHVLRRQHGTFVFRGPWLSALHSVVTCDPANLEHLLKSSFHRFPKGPHFRDVVRDLLGDGIFAADGDAWQRQRKVASIEFHSTRFRRMTADSLRYLVHARLIPVLETCAPSPSAENRGGSSFDLQDVLLRLTFDNVCLIAFGVDPGCLWPGLPEIPFARAFEDATEAVFLRFVTPTFLWKAMRCLGVGPERRLRESIKGVYEFAGEVIRRRRDAAAAPSDAKGGAGGEEPPDLLSVFMGLKDEGGRPFSDSFLRDICVNFILAGRDTSSVALTWFFWLLHRNPTVEERIVAEIRRVKTERRDEGGGTFVFEPEEIKRMDYLQAALSEALRLYPSVPVDHKEAAEDDVFPDGTVLKKGTKVIYAIYAMGRMEGIWGKDCREFRPERWLRDGRFSGESAYKFTAFNGGPRLCLGKDFAYYQMKFVAAAVLCRYRVEVVEHHPVKPKLALTMYLKHGLQVMLRPRDEPQLPND